MTEQQYDQDQLRYWFDGWDHYAQTLLFDYHQIPRDLREEPRGIGAARSWLALPFEKQ